MSSAHEKATLLIKEINNALQGGTKHYAIDGRELKTTKEVLEALNKDGRIVFKPKTDFTDN